MKNNFFKYPKIEVFLIHEKKDSILFKFLKEHFLIYNIKILNNIEKDDILILKLKKENFEKKILSNNKNTEYILYANIFAELFFKKNVYPVEVNINKSYFEKEDLNIVKDIEKEIIFNELLEDASNEIMLKIYLYYSTFSKK